jgi:hypothetical protein
MCKLENVSRSMRVTNASTLHITHFIWFSFVVEDLAKVIHHLYYGTHFANLHIDHLKIPFLVVTISNIDLRLTRGLVFKKIIDWQAIGFVYSNFFLQFCNHYNPI